MDTPFDTPFVVGQAYFIRTVTFHLIGRVEAIAGKFLTLSEASWVADSGRFHDAIVSGLLSEVEPVEIAFVNMDSITDAFPWLHALPRNQK